MIEDEGNLGKAYKYALFGNILFASAQVFFKKATQTLSPFEVLYLRSIFLLALAMVVIKKKQLSVYISSKEVFKKVFWRVVIMGGGVILIYESLPYIPVSTVNTLDNLAPIFIFFIEAVAYKKCLDFVSLTLAVLSFIGVMLIIQPEFIFGSNQQQPVENLSFYVTLMILAAIFTALNVHFVHGLGKQLHYVVNMTYSYIGHLFISGVICNFDFQKNHLERLSWEFILIMIGLVVSAFGSAYLLVISNTIVKPSKTMPLGYVGIMVGFVADVYLFDTKFTLLPVLGMLLTSSSLFSQVFRNQPKPLENPQEESKRADIQEMIQQNYRTSK